MINKDKLQYEADELEREADGLVDELPGQVSHLEAKASAVPKEMCCFAQQDQKAVMNKRYKLESELALAEAALEQTEEELESLEDEVDYMRTSQEEQSKKCNELRAKLKDLGP